MRSYQAPRFSGALFICLIVDRRKIGRFGWSGRWRFGRRHGRRGRDVRPRRLTVPKPTIPSLTVRRALRCGRQILRGFCGEKRSRPRPRQRRTDWRAGQWLLRRLIQPIHLRRRGGRRIDPRGRCFHRWRHRVRRSFSVRRRRYFRRPGSVWTIAARFALWTISAWAITSWSITIWAITWRSVSS
jgi:hypothetical protein